MRELKILSGTANPQLAQDICGFLHLELGSITLGKFPDGENFCKINDDVRGRDVYLIQPTCPPVNDNLLELLIMIDSCKRASAARVTTVIPYFGYARQDRKDEGRVPITAKLVANMIARAGADRVLTMDLHAAQIQGFFDVPVDHLYAAPVLNSYFEDMGYAPDEIVVVSPDEGSIKRAVGHVQATRRTNWQLLTKGVASAFETKQEEHHRWAGGWHGSALMFDDMISTAGSICGAARTSSRKLGAREIHVATTHGVLCGDGRRELSATRRFRIAVVMTNTAFPLQEGTDACHRCKVVVSGSASGRGHSSRIHHDQSISAIFRGGEDRP